MPAARSPVRPVRITVYHLPVETRMPYRFGSETLTSVTCVRVKMTVADDTGRQAVGWGEAPLSVQWVWPGDLPYGDRYDALMHLIDQFADAWLQESPGHPIEAGWAFQNGSMLRLQQEWNAANPDLRIPQLAALLCAAPFDIALHDAYANLLQRPAYHCYGPDCMGDVDLSAYLEPDAPHVSFENRYPSEFVVSPLPTTIPVWHVVGGHDPLTDDDLDGSEPDDGYPVTLVSWIESDGLKCLKIKLCGIDAEWDYQRIVRVGQLAIAHDLDWLTTDFNCTVTNPAYVCDVLDRLMREHPRIYGMLLYVEQPFPYELEEHKTDVHAVSARKPLFMDESAHDWRHVRLGRQLGWTGVALKTCKTQTGAILSLCWAKAHGMPLMVQDLTNPSLAQIPHVLLAAHADTIMGVESNAMQFYPDASTKEAAIHPGIYKRRNGILDLSTLTGNGFAYGAAATTPNLPPHKEVGS